MSGEIIALYCIAILSFLTGTWMVFDDVKEFAGLVIISYILAFCTGNYAHDLTKEYRKESMMIIEGDTIYCEDCGRDMIIATIREEAGKKVIHYHCRKCGSEVGDKVATEEEMDRLKHWVLD